MNTKTSFSLKQMCQGKQLQWSQLVTKSMNGKPHKANGLLIYYHYPFFLKHHQPSKTYHAFKKKKNIEMYLLYCTLENLKKIAMIVLELNVVCKFMQLFLHPTWRRTQELTDPRMKDLKIIMMVNSTGDEIVQFELKWCIKANNRGKLVAYIAWQILFFLQANRVYTFLKGPDPDLLGFGCSTYYQSYNQVIILANRKVFEPGRSKRYRNPCIYNKKA